MDAPQSSDETPQDSWGEPSGQTSAVDFDRLAEVTANDPQLLREIANQYLEQAEEILAEMEDCIQRSDHVSLRQLAHKLVGSSATCGMTAIIDPLRSMEHLEDERAAEFPPLRSEARNQLQRIRNSLERGEHPQ